MFIAEDKRLDGETLGDLLKELFNEGVKCGRNGTINNREVIEFQLEDEPRKALLAEVLGRFGEQETTAKSLRKQIQDREDLIADLGRKVERAKQTLQENRETSQFLLRVAQREPRS